MQVLIRCLTAALVLVLGATGEHSSASQTSQHQPETPTAEQLVGAWRLVSVETVRANGEVIYPFYGKHPEGILIYDRSGWMSVQIVSDPKPATPKTDSREGFLAAPMQEKANAADGYYGYYGTWTFDPSVPAVIHHIEQSFYPGERGETGIRRLSIAGNRLTLLAKAHEMGQEHERRLVWQKIVSLPD